MIPFWFLRGSRRAKLLIERPSIGRARGVRADPGEPAQALDRAAAALAKTGG